MRQTTLLLLSAIAGAAALGAYSAPSAAADAAPSQAGVEDHVAQAR